MARRIARFFPDREIYMRSNGEMRFLRISSSLQFMVVTGLLLVALGWLAITGTTLLMRVEIEARAAKVASSAGRMEAFQSSVDGIAERLEARQRRLDMLVGRYFGEFPDKQKTALRVSANARLGDIEQQQLAFAGRLNAVAAQRSQLAETTLRRLGINTNPIAGRSRAGIGGPFIPLASNEAALVRLDQSLNRLDRLERTVLALPATIPASPVMLSSTFGVRSDPFNGAAAMHTGLDMRGRYGQPIYAAAPGRVIKVGPWSGYGNVIVIDHGHGIETRYGHLSGFAVREGAVVTPGQQIARMGSTGRSTGNHLHFEVRINGRAVNPRPFLEASRDVLEIQARVGQRLADGERG